MLSGKVIHKEKNFNVEVIVDHANQILEVIDYEPGSMNDFYFFLWSLAGKYNLGKIILPIRPYDLYLLQSKHFIVEGFIDNYFSGIPGCILGIYPQTSRSLNPLLSEEQKLLTKILLSSQTKECTFTSEFQINQIEEKDVPVVCSTFKKMFITYPLTYSTPSSKNIYMAAFYKNQIVSLAAAELNLKYSRAEITSCATLPEHQDIRLMKLLVNSLCEKCKDMGIKCIYSIARASFYNMNVALHQLGYLYRGTLINNCYVNDRFENMNIWVCQSF